MKKLLAICLSVLLICAAMPFAFATASEEPTIVVSDAEGKAGETVSVTVSMKNNPGITSTKVKVHYDTNALELLAKPDGYAMGDFSASGYSWGDTTKSPFVINWCDMINPNNTAELLATLNFKIKDDAAAGTYPLTLEYDNEGDIYNEDWDTVIFGSKDGSITVIGDEPALEIPETPEGAIYFAHFQTGDLHGWQSGCNIEVVAENDGKAMKWDASGADWANMYNYTTNVAKNTEYVLTMDVKADRNTNMNLKVLKGDWSADAFKTTFDVTTEWQTVTVPFSTNDGSFLLLSSNTKAASGATYYLDNISVVEYVAPVEPDVEEEVAGNLFVNGTFEGGNADGWKTYQGSAATTDAAKNGAYGFNAIGNGGWGGMFNQTVAVETGKSYTLSFWIKVVSNGVNIQVKDADGTKFDGSPAGWYSTSNYSEWTYVSKTFVAHADSLTFNVCGAGNNTPESAYIDSITLVKEKDPSFDGYITNGDFETGNLTGWTNLWDSCTVKFVEGYESDTALSVVMPKQWQQVRQNLIPVEANTTYRLSAYVKNAQNVSFVIKEGNDSFDLTPSEIGAFPAGEDWQKFTMEFNTGVNKNGEAVTIDSICVLIISYGENGGSVIIDNITMEKVEEPAVEPEIDVEGNLFVNGTFESGNADGWKTYQGSAATTDAAKNGAYGFNAIGNGGWGGMFNQTVAVEVGKTYTMSFWVKIVSNGVNIQVKDADGTKFDGSPAGWYSASNYSEWTYVEKTFVAHADSLTFNVCGAGNGTPESAYIDSITLVKEKDPSFDGYITNGDFEMNNLAGWINLWNNNTVEFVEGMDSDYAISITTDKSWAQVRQDGIKVEPNTDYVLTGWFKNNTNLGYCVKAGDDSGDIKSYLPSETYGDWTKVSLEFNSGDQTSICVLLMSWSDGGSAIIDNVSLAKVEKPVEPEYNEPTIVVSDAQGDAGDTVTVTVSMKKNPGIVSTKVKVGYNADALELLEYAAGDFSQSGYSWGQLTKNPFVINWCDAISADSTAELLATLTFKIKDTAIAGEYALTLTYDNDGDIYNTAWETVVFGADEGVITVVNGASEACKHEYDGACDPDCNLCGETRDVHVNLIHFDAVDAGCHYIGNIEYWFCADCEMFWADEALTQVTNSKSVIVPALGGETIHFEAIEPGCHYNGRIEYWYCAECDQFWADEALTQLTNSKNVILPATGSDKLQHVEAKDPTCLEAGNTEYWYCAECDQYWANEALTQLTNAKNVVIAPVDHNIAHIDAVEAGCHYIGNIEYWYCADCGSYWADEALTQITNSKSVIIPALGGEVIFFEAIEPACHYNGRIAYWYCAECDQFWADEALTQITNSKKVILPATGSDKLQHVEAKDPTCLEAGNTEYWYCSDCDQYWANEALTQLTNSKNVIIAPVDHNIAHIDAVEPGCHYIGNIEYWYCADCGSYWADEALTQITNSKNVLLPATGSDKLQHVEAKAPTATENGNIEYWYCAECEQFWADEALTQLTNSKNVIIAATGEPSSPSTGDTIVPVMIALLTLIASGAAVVVLKNKKHA